MKINNQNKEIGKLLYDVFPGGLTTHQLRMQTWIVDVPKRRSELLKMGINIISEPDGFHQNKFGRKIRVTKYRVDIPQMEETKTLFDDLVSFFSSNIKN
jgi:hypothetical protein